MTMPDLPLSLRAYFGATHLVPLIATRHLQKRVGRGKEHPKRWTEKLGEPSIARPAGRLIWLNAVGLGEVLSLRGLIAAMAENSDAHFLITSSTLAGANVLSKNSPPRTTHQFLPIDSPRYRKRFLDHWQPDLCIWAEQDIWPGFVHTLAQRHIPQVMVAARMNTKSMTRRKRFAGVHTWLYDQMALVTAQDKVTQENLLKLGATAVRITGSLKPAAPALTFDLDELAALQDAVGSRFVWITAPSHPADESLAITAHQRLLKVRPDALLIIAPRYPDRQISSHLSMSLRSRGEIPTHQAIYVADTFGDLGLLYKLANIAFIGGTNDDTEGHSPWEAAALGTAILHGPRIANFAADYAALHGADAAVEVDGPDRLATLLTQDLTAQVARATVVVSSQRAATVALAEDLLVLI